ncbi:MAG: hypothetical protein LQ343_004749 [Gyalolechia ehrenbergii]|nr:MAG: hypothetical protein LQ343_004749 [Gyalolechia ehrenbergii]
MSRLNGVLISLATLEPLELLEPLGPLGLLGVLGPLGILGPLELPVDPLDPVDPVDPLDPLDLVVLDPHLLQESRPVLGVLGVLYDQVLPASLLVLLDQLPLAFHDDLGVLVDLAVRERLVLPVVLQVLVHLGALEVLGVLKDPLFAVVETFSAVVRCSKQQAATAPPN